MKKFEFCVEWGATAILMCGVALAAYNVYPLGAWISLAGNLGWFCIGIMWKKWSLIVIQVLITILYGSGLLNHYGIL